MTTNNLLLTKKETQRKLPRYIYTPLRISLSLSFLVTLLSIIFFTQIQPEIPLFYSLPRSSQQLVHKAWIFFFPAFSFFISLLHFSVVTFSQHLKNRLKKLFFWTTVIMQLILFLVFIRVIYIIQ